MEHRWSGNGWQHPDQINQPVQAKSAMAFLKELQNAPEQHQEMQLDDSQATFDEDSHKYKLLRTKLNEVRSSLNSFNFLKDKPQDQYEVSQIPKCANIILFGPAGSGKSSLIRTLYTSIHGVYDLPEELNRKLRIQNLLSNEGTVNFTKAELKPAKHDVLKTGDKEIIYKQTGINIFDTRGQVQFTDQEKEATSLAIDGKVRDGSQIRNRERYAYLLYEFWKSDAELFPNEILNNDASLNSKPHCIVFVFDGSQKTIPQTQEETQFYRSVIQRCYNRKYGQPQVVLTRFDTLEERITNQIRRGQLDKGDKERTLREQQDMQIEMVAKNLQIPRSSVFFIENYSEKRTRSDVMVDFYSIKLLQSCVAECERYVESQVKKESTCELI